MEFVVPSIQELGVGLRALKMVALADGELHPVERSVIEAGQRVFGDTRDLDALEPISPDELAAGVTAPSARHQLFGGMVVVCMADGEVNAQEAACLREFATAMELDDPVLGQLERIAKGQYRRARLDILRRFWAIEKLRSLAKDQGIGLYFKSLLGLLGVSEDTETINKYKAFSDLPPGSLGRTYYDYIQANGFDWPGSKGAPPGVIIYHDFSHILSGYGTTPEEECLVAAFSAGYAEYEVLSIFTFVLSQFQLGLQTAPRVPTSTMQLDPERFIRAYKRGAAMNVNLNDGWDFWEVIDQPIDVLRERYNVLPE